MSNAGQNQKQGEFAEWLLAESGSHSELGGDLLEGMEQAEDGAGSGIGNGGMVELAAEKEAEGGDASRWPGGEIEEGAIFDLAVFAEGLAQEDGGRRGAVGDLRDVHNHSKSQLASHRGTKNFNYITTSNKPKRH
jgi:hypothetical protein